MARGENKRKILKRFGAIGFLSVHRSHVRGINMIRKNGYLEMLDRNLDSLRRELGCPRKRNSSAQDVTKK